MLHVPTPDTSPGSPLLFSLAALISDFSFLKYIPIQDTSLRLSPASCEIVVPQFPSLTDPGHYRAAPSVENMSLPWQSQDVAWRFWRLTGQHGEEAPTQHWGCETAWPELSDTWELGTELRDCTSWTARTHSPAGNTPWKGITCLKNYREKNPHTFSPPFISIRQVKSKCIWT